jgi:long-subunit fatty acid transport protein
MKATLRRRVLDLSLLAGLVALPAGARAQETPTRNGPPPVQYNFAPPGARSLAMGASFIGLADDATASESNPAGLTILTRPEFSAHFRYTSFETNAPNTVTGEGFSSFKDSVGSPSFFSLVYPMKNAAFSLSYQRAADYKSHSFFDGVFPTQDGELANYDQVETSFRVENTGLSAGFKLGPHLSIGGSARLTRVALDGLQRTTFPFADAFGFLPAFLVRQYVAPDVAKSEFTWNAGVLFTPVSKISIGGVYKKGAKYDFNADFVTDTVDSSNTPQDFERTNQPLPIRIPDVYGGGLAVRPTESWTILADVIEVRYSQADPGPGYQNIYQLFGEGGREALKDATELHLGTEYTWGGGSDWLFAVRAGYYSDPDHDGLAGLNSKQNHGTFGGGVVFKNRLQIDIAANLAKYVKEGLISVVTRF